MGEMFVYRCTDKMAESEIQAFDEGLTNAIQEDRHPDED
jgi:hypothetical protein